MGNNKFINKVLAGKAKPGDVDDYIDRWNENPHGMPLSQYLGLTPDEYASFVERADNLHGIIARRAATGERDEYGKFERGC